MSGMWLTTLQVAVLLTTNSIAFCYHETFNQKLQQMHLDVHFQKKDIRLYYRTINPISQLTFQHSSQDAVNLVMIISINSKLRNIILMYSFSGYHILDEHRMKKKHICSPH